MFAKIWDAHVVHEEPGKQAIIYIDRHLVHEVTSPQAFEGLRLAGRQVRRPSLTTAVPDHNVPTTDRSKPNPDPESTAQIAYLAENAKFAEICETQGLIFVGPPPSAMARKECGSRRPPIGR